MLSPFHSKFWILMDFLHSSAEVLGALVFLSSVCILQPTAASHQADKNIMWNPVLTHRRGKASREAGMYNSSSIS